MLRYLLLDLDNTLYPDSSGMERDILARMTAYLAAYLGLSLREARERRRERVKDFGTTLEWLMAEEGFVEVEDYFAKVHPEGEERCLSPEPSLGALLDSLPLPKAVFTNSPREHADRVLRRLGIADRFEGIYDIRFNGLKGKPHPEAYARVCAACGVSPEEAIFVDDLPKYVRGFVEIGGKGILLDERDRHAEEGLPRIRSLAELSPIVRAGLGEAGRGLAT
jgi:putative hydrolase of the HAD superfamily